MRYILVNAQSVFTGFVLRSVLTLFTILDLILELNFLTFELFVKVCYFQSSCLQSYCLQSCCLQWSILFTTLLVTNLLFTILLFKNIHVVYSPVICNYCCLKTSILFTTLLFTMPLFTCVLFTTIVVYPPVRWVAHTYP